MAKHTDSTLTQGDPDVRELNRLIRLDGNILFKLQKLLLQERPLDKWPRQASSALAAALERQPGNRIEDAKADRLRRHLFVDMPAPQLVNRGAPKRCGDRIRADLPDFVPAGAGLHLVDYETVVSGWTTRAS